MSDEERKLEHQLERPARTETPDDGHDDGSSGNSRAAHDDNTPLPTSSSGIAGPVPVFLERTYAMVDKPESDVISWSETGDSFVVTRVDELEALLPLFFSHANFLSFVRQLNFYGFSKVKGTAASQKGERATSGKRRQQGADGTWEFMHPSFQRGRRDLLSSIKRRKDRFSSKHGRARSQVDRLNDFKRDMELVSEGLKRVDAKVDDIRALLLSVYGEAAAPRADKFRRKESMDPGGGSDMYAELVPQPHLLAPQEPTDNSQRQQFLLDQHDQQQHQRPPLYSRMQAASSSAHPSGAVGVSMQPMRDASHGAQSDFNSFGAAHSSVSSRISREVPSEHYPIEDQSLLPMISPHGRAGAGGGQPADWGSSSSLNNSVTSSRAPTLSAGNSSSYAAGRADSAGRVQRAFRLNSSTPYHRSCSLPHDARDASQRSSSSGAASALSTAGPVTAAGATGVGMAERESLGAGAASRQSSPGGRMTSLSCRDYRGMGEEQGQRQQGLEQAASAKRSSNSAPNRRDKPEPARKKDDDSRRVKQRRGRDKQ